MAESKNNKKRCSFCGRSENEVGFLITGMNGYICDSCATQAYEITQEAMGAGKQSAGATRLNLKELPKPVEMALALFASNPIISPQIQFTVYIKIDVLHPCFAA